MKKIYSLLAFVFVLGLTYVNAQTPSCPLVPSTAAWNELNFMRTPELKIGQGRVANIQTSQTYDIVIPNNRFTWAIAVAHSWQLYRNTFRTELMHPGFWLATSIKESNGTCDDQATWDAVTYPQAPMNAWAATSVFNADGCFHTDQSGYVTIASRMPTRFDCSAVANQHAELMGGDNFETGAISKAFYDIIGTHRLAYEKNLDPFELWANTQDPYAIEHTVAFYYNRGLNAGGADGVFVGAGRTGAYGWNHWALQAGFEGNGNYGKEITKMVAVLENDVAWADARFPLEVGQNQFYGYFDEQIAWDTVNRYIDKILPLYPDMDIQSIINYKTDVKAVFDGVNTGLSISFRYDFPVVLDAIILGLPKDDPVQSAVTAVEGKGCGLKTECWGPYTEIRADGPITFCSGLSVTLSADVLGAKSGAVFQWKKNGIAIASETNETLIVTDQGDYTVEVCRDYNYPTGWPAGPKDGTTELCCVESHPVTVNVDPACSGCNLTAIASVVTPPTCSRYTDGELTVVVAGSGGSGNYNFLWTGAGAGTTQNLLSATDGKYAIEVVDQADPACKAFDFIEVFPTYEVLDSIIGSVDKYNSCFDADLESEIIKVKGPCDITIKYGVTAPANWDVAFTMDVLKNGRGVANLFEPGTPPVNKWKAPYGTWDRPPTVTKLRVTDGDIIDL